MTAPVLGNVAADHPAKWSTPVLEALADIADDACGRMGKRLTVLDPCAGIGRARLASALGSAARHVHGVELQPEWCPDGATVPGDARNLALWPTGSVSAVVSSFVYPNRTTDHHNAKDPCKKCKGTGLAQRLQPEALGRPCETCKGTGLSWRNTYAHALRRHGADLVPDSMAGKGWGPGYRLDARLMLAEAVRVLEEGGLLALNMSNHAETLVKGGPQVEQLVVEWYTNELLVMGCRLWEVRRVRTRRYRKGANGHRAQDDQGNRTGADPRVDGEVVIVVHTPSPRRLARKPKL